MGRWLLRSFLAYLYFINLAGRCLPWARAGQRAVRFTFRLRLYPMPLYHLIYESRATQPFSDLDLLGLLRHSRGYNAQRGLTGLLLYAADGRFLQVLEGEREEVDALYQRIRQDARHTACMALLAGPLATRRFAEWRMGFRATRHLTDMAALLGHVDTSSPDFLLPLVPKLSTSLLDRIFDYLPYTPAHALLEEQVA